MVALLQASRSRLQYAEPWARQATETSCQKGGETSETAQTCSDATALKCQYTGAAIGVLTVQPSREAMSKVLGRFAIGSQVIQGVAEVDGCKGVTSFKARSISKISRNRERALDLPIWSMKLRLEGISRTRV